MSKKWQSGYKHPSSKGLYEIRFKKVDGSPSLLSHEVDYFLRKWVIFREHNKDDERGYFEWRGPLTKPNQTDPMHKKFIDAQSAVGLH